MSRAFILTEGGRGVGFGHITRCISLYQAFREKNIIAQFIVNGDETIRGLLRDTKHRIFNWLKEKGKLFGLIENADIVIMDSYLAGHSLYAEISEKASLSIYIDDNKRLDYLKGIVVNGSIGAQEMVYPRNKGTFYLLGTQYAILRKEFWNVPRKEIKDKITSILVTFGGEDRRNMTLKILKFLNDKYPGIKKNTIIGGGFLNIRDLEDMEDGRTNLIYEPDAEKIKEVMLDSDIAISAGGQTLYELARVGVPTVGICVTDNQQQNVLGWRREGFIECGAWYNTAQLLAEIKNSITYLEDVDIRRNISKIGRKYIDGKGALRITEVICGESRSYS